MVCLAWFLFRFTLLWNNDFSQGVLVFCTFAICTVIYGSFAVIGFLMFGENTLSQITLNLPKHSVASKVALWTTVTTASRPKFTFSNSEIFSLYYLFKRIFLTLSFILLSNVFVCFQVINPFTKYPYHQNLKISVF